MSAAMGNGFAAKGERKDSLAADAADFKRSFGIGRRRGRRAG